MRNKTANNLLKILKLLIAEDVETVELGIGLFLINPILINIPKNRNFKLSTRWPVLNYKPAWESSLITRSYGSVDKIYTKIQFINVLNSKNSLLSKKVTLILNFCILISKGFFNKRDENHDLSFCIQRLNEINNITGDLISPKQYVIKDYYRSTDMYSLPMHPYFSEELSDLGIKSNFDCLSAIRDYKFFLYQRYNKVKINKLEQMFTELTDQYYFAKCAFSNIF